MKTRIVITDLTRMYHGHVCLAGYTGNRCCVRPVLKQKGISERSLYLDNGRIITPFSVVDLELLEPDPQPPHTEDVLFREGSFNFIRMVNDRKSVLGWSLFKNVEDIFEQEIQSGPGYFVIDCRGPRSLGTISSLEIHEVRYEMGMEGVWDYRLCFYDGSNQYYRLKITDLTWQYYCNHLKDEKNTPIDVARRITEDLKKREIYLRIGLARGWKKFPERCYLQITGIYTFPDYLEGKNFSLFKSAPDSEG